MISWVFRGKRNVFVHVLNVHLRIELKHRKMAYKDGKYYYPYNFVTQCS